MEKIYSKVLLPLLLLLSVFSKTTTAQTPTYQSIHTVNSSNIYPLSDNSNNKVQWLYLVSDIAPAATNGLITKVYFNLPAAYPNPATYTNFEVSIGTTTRTAQVTAYVTGLQQCYFSASFTAPPNPAAGGWLEVTLQNPFLWTGTDNLIIELRQAGYTGGGRNMNQTLDNGIKRIFGGYNAVTGNANTGQVKIGFDMMPATPCTNPPTPGIATVSDTLVCPNGSILLNLSGNSIGLNQTYEWESSADNITFASIGAPANTPIRTYNVPSTQYLRCKIVCSNSTPVYSTSKLVSVRSPLPGGTYTINRALPTSATNFTNFTALADRLNCGISGPIVVNVVPNSGPYTDRFLLTSIQGSSAVNTVRINGNGNTLQYNNTATDLQIVRFSGTRYVTIDSLTIKTLSASHGYAILFTNDAKYDTITNCNIDLSTITATGSTNATCLALSNSTTSPTSSGLNGSNLYIANNMFNAGHPTTNGGAYYAISLYGTTSTAGGADSIYILNNEIKNFYYYGIYGYYGRNSEIIGNNIHKTGKTANSTSYGMYIYYFNGLRVEKNKIHDFVPSNNVTSATYGMYINYTNFSGNNRARTYIVNNSIYNVGNAAAFRGINSTYADSTYIYHNTINVNLQNTTSTTTQYGIYLRNANNTMFVKNNNVAFSLGNIGTKYGIYCEVADVFSTSAGLQRNNVFMGSTQAGTQNAYYYNATNYLTMPLFTAAFPTLEVGSTAVSPDFFNPAINNYAPTNPLVVANGEDLTSIVPTDINGLIRPAPPTPGAYDLRPEDINNAGVDSLISPSGNFCASVSNIKVRIRNYSIDVINTVTVNWSVNGQVQTPVIHNVSIDNRNTANSTAEINLGSYLLIFNRNYDVKVWTSDPNSNLDKDNGNDTLTFRLTPTSALSLDLGNDTLICDNVPVVKVAGPNNNQFSYLWDNAEVSNSRSILLPGSYNVLKTEVSTGCVGTDTIVVTTMPVPTIDLGADTAICPEQPLVLDAGAHNAINTILWEDNTTSRYRTVQSVGNYSVSVTNVAGCVSMDAIRVDFRDEPQIVGINTVLMLNANYNFNLLNPRFVSMAIWDYGDGSAVDTGFFVSHSYTTNGRYNVTVKLLGECSESSTPRLVTETLDVFDASTSIEELNGVTLKLYPNPAQDAVNITINGGKIEQVTIFNVLGQKMKLDIEKQQHQTSINTATLAAGVYNVIINTDKGTVSRKLNILK